MNDPIESMQMSIELLRHKPSVQEAEDFIATKTFFRVDEAHAQANGISLAEQKDMVLTTVCLILCKNGTKVVGQAHSHDAAYYTKEDGEKFSYQNALSQIFPLLTNERKSQIATLQALIEMHRNGTLVPDGKVLLVPRNVGKSLTTSELIRVLGVDAGITDHQ